jgi:hypothetical protein
VFPSLLKVSKTELDKAISLLKSIYMNRRKKYNFRQHCFSKETTRF